MVALHNHQTQMMQYNHNYALNAHKLHIINITIATAILYTFQPAHNSIVYI